MKCPYCNEFRGNSRVRGYPVSEQLIRHIEVKHWDKMGVSVVASNGEKCFGQDGSPAPIKS